MIQLTDNIQLYNADNMEVMKTFKDKEFDLAIVDPEYGINASNMTMGSGKNKLYKKSNWDKIPASSKYFNELFRISKNQIICGGNYFNLPISSGWIFWDKGINGDCSFADGELLWTSFNKVLRKANIIYKGFLGADKERIHITQKPIKLYEWLLNNYANQNDKIIDTHLGSGSITIAIDKANTLDKKNFTFVGIELDKDYFDASKLRFDNYKSQQTLF